ncbi:MAG: 2-C-methyl-D-erythritol 2,4-cyclodiphosphate synthase [Bacteroidales bacterium]
MKFRTGFGYDVHALADGFPLHLGGIQLQHSKGIIAHSDGDVLIHAICDALLGAANLGDIGHHFPDTDPKYKGVNSVFFLEKIISLLRKKGYELGNIDSSLVLEKPKLQNLIPSMQKQLSLTLSVDIDQISIKATTSEKLGFLGREEGVAAYASVLIYQV